jgi:hypothetical protein
VTAVSQARYKARRQEADPEAWRIERREIEARFRTRHPQKKAAWNAVYRALQSGRLVRPGACERCGTACSPQASHDDYAMQLDVEWLCQDTTKDGH